MTDVEAWAELGSRLRVAREKTGLSRRQAAKSAGMSDGWWRWLENGGVRHSDGTWHTPTHSTAMIVAAATAVGLSPRSLLRLVGRRYSVADVADARTRPLTNDELVVILDGIAEQLRSLTADVEALRAQVAPSRHRRSR